jgi:hypothetical protein
MERYRFENYIELSVKLLVILIVENSSKYSKNTKIQREGF